MGVGSPKLVTNVEKGEDIFVVTSFLNSLLPKAEVLGAKKITFKILLPILYQKWKKCLQVFSHFRIVFAVLVVVGGFFTSSEMGINCYH